MLIIWTVSRLSAKVIMSVFAVFSKVRICKISDKTSKFLLIAIYFGVHFLSNTVYITVSASKTRVKHVFSTKKQAASRDDKPN